MKNNYLLPFFDLMTDCIIDLNTHKTDYSQDGDIKIIYFN